MLQIIPILSNGQIIVGAGGIGSNFVLARFNADGSLDTTFGSSGIETGAAISSGLAMVIANSGEAVMIGRPASGYGLILQEFHTLANKQVLYVEQDADYNVTSLTNSSGTVVERYSYDGYGNVTVMNANGTVRGDGTAGSSEYDETVLYQGLDYSTSTGVYATETRFYSPMLGRPLTEDPAGYINGPNREQWEVSDPDGLNDPSGLGVGHHITPKEFILSLPDGEGKTALDRLTTGNLDGGHGWSEEHQQYNDAVETILNDTIDSGEIDLEHLGANDAYKLVSKIISSDNPAIKNFLAAIQKQIDRKVNKAFDQAVAKTLEEEGEKEVCKLIAKRGGKNFAQALVRNLLKAGMKDVPVIAIVFFLMDAKTKGANYAIKNAVVPADLIGDLLQGYADGLRDWADQRNSYNTHGKRNGLDFDPYDYAENQK